MLKKIFYFLPTIALVLLFSLFSSYQNQKIVTRVIDGDTLEIEGSYRIRLLGIDSPEQGEPFYEEAVFALKEMVEGKKVIMEKDPSVDRDKYGRFLRYVFVEGKLVNCELVRMGLAKALVESGVKYGCFQDEEEAREKKLGIWSSS